MGMKSRQKSDKKIIKKTISGRKAKQHHALSRKRQLQEPKKKPIAGLTTVQANIREKPMPPDVFWADSLAVRIIERAKREGKTATCKAGASPSGGKHIGNMFDVLKSWIVYKAIKRKFPDARFVHTSDDMDPLRTVPERLPDLEGRWQSTSDMREKISTYLGHPYVNIPDPFGCCESWAEHFTKVWTNGFFALGLTENEVKLFSNKTLYRDGMFDPYIAMIFKNIELSRLVLARFQEHVSPDYIPFHAICENCGKITTTVTDFDIEDRIVKYVCTGRELAGKYVISGCNHKGETSWHSGKLPWKFEWPAQWGIFGVLFEPFGKEHAEGSWPTGQAIAKEIYRIEPPIPHVYEFMLVDGEKMSSRRGNAFTVQEMLEIIEPEIFNYFYTKRSLKQRNLDIKNIYRLVDEFERAERVYFNIEENVNKREKENLIREYESAMSHIPRVPPVRIEYQFAAIIAQIAPDLERAIHMLRASGHIKQDRTLHADDQGIIAKRLSLAKNWVEKFSPENKIVINESVPKSVLEKLNGGQKSALRDLAKVLEDDVNQVSLYNSFYEIAKRNNIAPADFFRGLYLCLISKTSGPRAAPFIMALGKERVREILSNM